MPPVAQIRVNVPDSRRPGRVNVVCVIVLVHDGADLKNKLMGVIVYCYPAEKINK
jgi:hypothetical protein